MSFPRASNNNNLEKTTAEKLEKINIKEK